MFSSDVVSRGAVVFLTLALVVNVVVVVVRLTVAGIDSLFVEYKGWLVRTDPWMIERLMSRGSTSVRENERKRGDE